MNVSNRQTTSSQALPGQERAPDEGRPVGRLIVFEGPDKSGKTTLTAAIARGLSVLGIPHVTLSFPGRSERTVGQWVYDLHHDPTRFVDRISPACLQTLHVAAQADAIERTILPALERGLTVLLDRYWWSTWVYGIASGVSPAFLEPLVAAEKQIWGGWAPSQVYLMHRPQSLPDATLTREYEVLAAREERSYPVHLLSNAGALEDVVERVFHLSGWGPFPWAAAQGPAKGDP